MLPVSVFFPFHLLPLLLPNFFFSLSLFSFGLLLLLLLFFPFLLLLLSLFSFYLLLLLSLFSIWRSTSGRASYGASARKEECGSFLKQDEQYLESMFRIENQDNFYRKTKLYM